VATKLPGVPATHDKEKSNRNGFLSMREIRLERLESFFCGAVLIGVIRDQLVMSQQLAGVAVTQPS
jgi:hypothetical protein